MLKSTVGGVQGIFLPLPDAPKQYIPLVAVKGQCWISIASR
jgi:hypothetical protein